MKRFKLVKIAFLIALVIGIGIPAPIASATSPYDNAYTVSGDTSLYNQSCGPGGINDYSATIEDILDAVEANSTYGPQLTAAIASGNMGVSNFTKHSINGPIISNSIQVFWTSDDSLYLEWTNEFNPYSNSYYNAVLAHGSTSTLTSVFVNATNDMFGNCQLSVSSTGFSNLAFVSEATDDGGVRSNYIETNHPNYPSGYEGGEVGYKIQGNVMCADPNSVLSAIHIDTQNGPDRNATLSDGGNGSKNYVRYLTEPEPYSIVAICNGEAYYGPTVEDTFSYNYHWVCTDTTPGQNPNTKVCAAS